MSANVSIEGVAFVRTDNPSMVVNQKVSAGIPEGFTDVAWGGCFFFQSHLKRGTGIPDPSIPGCSYWRGQPNCFLSRCNMSPLKAGNLSGNFFSKMASIIAIPFKGTT